MRAGSWLADLGGDLGWGLFVPALVAALTVATIASARGIRVRASAWIVPVLLVPIPTAISMLATPGARAVEPLPRLPDGYLRDAWLEHFLTAESFGTAAWTALLCASSAWFAAWVCAIATTARNARWAPLPALIGVAASGVTWASWPRRDGWHPGDWDLVLATALVACSAPCVLAWATCPDDGLAKRLRATSCALAVVAGGWAVLAVHLLDEAVGWWPSAPTGDIVDLARATTDPTWAATLTPAVCAAVAAVPGALPRARFPWLLMAAASAFVIAHGVIALRIADRLASVGHPDVAEAIEGVRLPVVRGPARADLRGDPVIAWDYGDWSRPGAAPFSGEWPLVVAPADLPARELARHPWFAESGYLNVAYRETDRRENPRGNADLRTMPIVWDRAREPERFGRREEIGWRCIQPELPAPSPDPVARAGPVVALIDTNGRDRIVTADGMLGERSSFEGALLNERPDRVVFVPGADWSVWDVVSRCAATWELLQRDATNVDCVISPVRPEAWLAAQGLEPDSKGS